MAEQTITPVTASGDEQTQRRLTIDPSITAPDGSFYVFDGQDGYRQVVAPHEDDAYIGPARVQLNLGDVSSWVAYVERYADPTSLLLTWSETGLRAVLDGHRSLTEHGRAQWIATHPFLMSDQWKAWKELANGMRWSQQQAVDKLDALADDIVSPDAATVIGIIRTLRSSVKMEASSDLREDGSSLVSWSKDSTVKSKAPIPPEIEIAIPVLKGHVDDQTGVPVTYRLPVKVRPSVDDRDHTLGLRFLMPTAERVWEAVCLDRVNAAKTLLGDTYSLLRAAS